MENRICPHCGWSEAERFDKLVDAIAAIGLKTDLIHQLVLDALERIGLLELASKGRLTKKG